MASRYTKSSYLLKLVVLFLFVTVVNGSKGRFEPVKEGYNRDICLIKVLQLLNESKIYSNDSIFYRGDDGTVFSSPKRPIITLDGCYEMCGTQYGWYKDIGNRLSTWLIPVFLLLSNMEVSPLDKRRYLGILHLLGDPIDSLLSMLIKLEAWSRCHYLAIQMTDIPDDAMRRNIATVLGGFEELIGFYEDPADVFSRVKNRSLKRYNSQAYFDHLVSHTAHQLADSRTDERIRTVFATVLYIYQLISAFVSVVGGGNTTLPGGRIGLAMFMTWIVGSILISNAMGTYTSRRVCYDKMEAFVKAATGQERGWQTMKEVAPTLKDHGSVSNFMRNLSWNGAIYSYRPKKTLPFKGRKHGHSLFLLALIAAAPVAISSIIASLILWNTPPIGINCRNIIIFVLTAAVFISAGLTHLSSLFLKGALHWYVVLAKDLIVAVPSIILIFLACAGRFNSCWCWSGAFSLGSKARVILETVTDFEKYNATTYPIMVAICLTLQCLAFVGMMWVGWRGWNVMRWSEAEKAAGWKQSRVPPRAVTRDVSPTKKQVLVKTREILPPRNDA